jgi:hypothetical protein
MASVNVTLVIYDLDEQEVDDLKSAVREAGYKIESAVVTPEAARHAGR